MSDKIRNEKHQDYTTPVTHYALCQSCGTRIGVHLKGRRPLYCGPACRMRAHRATPKLF